MRADMNRLLSVKWSTGCFEINLQSPSALRELYKSFPHGFLHGLCPAQMAIVPLRKYTFEKNKLTLLHIQLCDGTTSAVLLIDIMRCASFSCASTIRHRRKGW